MSLLHHYLKTLKLPTFLSEYERVASACVEEKASYETYLTRLSEKEYVHRQEASVQQRIKKAKFPVLKRSKPLILRRFHHSTNLSFSSFPKAPIWTKKKTSLRWETQAQERHTSPLLRALCVSLRKVCLFYPSFSAGSHIARGTGRAGVA